MVLTLATVLGIVVSVIATMALGMFWYSPAGFGKTWIKLQGWTEKSLKAQQKKAMKEGMAGTWLLGIVSNIVWVGVLALFLAEMNVTTLPAAHLLAFWVWLGFVATTQLASFLWERKPFKLFLFNTAYNLIALLIAATILFYLH